MNKFGQSGFQIEHNNINIRLFMSHTKNKCLWKKTKIK